MPTVPPVERRAAVQRLPVPLRGPRAPLPAVRAAPAGRRGALCPLRPPPAALPALFLRRRLRLSLGPPDHAPEVSRRGRRGSPAGQCPGRCGEARAGNGRSAGPARPAERGTPRRARPESIVGDRPPRGARAGPDGRGRRAAALARHPAPGGPGAPTTAAEPAGCAVRGAGAPAGDRRPRHRAGRRRDDHRSRRASGRSKAAASRWSTT